MAEGGIVARAITIALGLDFDGKGFGKAEDAIANVQKMVTRLGSAVAGGYLAKMFVDMVQQTTEMADHLDDYTTSLNLNAEAYQKLSYAAKLNGVEQEGLNGALGSMFRLAGKAAQGATEAAQKFSALGIHVKDSNGALKPTSTLFAEVGAAIRKISNPTNRTAAAMRIFGEEGARLVPLFEKSEEELAKYGAELDALGGVLDGDFIKASAEYHDELDRQNKALLGVRIAITRAVLPAFLAFAQFVTRLAASFSEVIKSTRAVEGAVISLGGFLTWLGIKATWTSRQLIWAWVRAAAPFLAVAAAIGLVALAIDDVWTYFEGGDSITGDVLGPIKNWIDSITSGTSTWGDVLRNIGGQLAWVPVFGTALTGIANALAFILDKAQQLAPVFAALSSAQQAAGFGALATALNIIKAAVEAIGIAFDFWEKKIDSVLGKVGGFRDLLGEAGSAASAASFGPLGLLYKGLQTYGAASQASPQGDAFRVPGGNGSNTVNNSNSVVVQPTINGGGDPQAISLEVGRQVEEVLQTHFDNGFAALVPSAG